MKYLILATCILAPVLTYSQNDTIWFNNKWEPTLKEQASFFRSPVIKEGDKFRIKDHFVSGQVQSNGLSLSATEDIWDGLVTYFYPNGVKKATANFVNNQLEGVFTEYYDTGELKGIVENKNNQRNGSYSMYDKNGTLLVSRSFVNGTPNGKIEQYYSNGKLDFRGYFKMGEKDGQWEAGYENGQPKTKYYLVNGNLEGPIFANDENGNLAYEGQFKNGTLVYFNNGGKTKLNGSNFELKGVGAKDGTEAWKLFRDGILITESFFTQGIKTGTWKMYSIDGSQLVRIMNYGDPGLCAKRPVAPVALFSVPFHSFPDYYFKLFAHNVSVIESEYAQGCLHGPTKEFDINGMLLQQIDFQNGVETSLKRYDDRNGIKRAVNSITFIKE